MGSLFQFLKPAPDLPEIQDPQKIKQGYSYWRSRIFYSMFFGYALYYFTRQSLVFTTPTMIQDLHFDKSEVGFLGSMLAITYGMSKFVSGVLADKSSPRYFMAIGLILTGVCNILFGSSSSLMMFALFWGLNGLFQGFGAPPCARFLTNWYSHSERGSWWSSWSVSHNVGGFVIPWLIGFILQSYDWRFAMYIPGVICIFGGLFLANRLRDSPQSLGLPSIEKYRNDYPANSKQDKEIDTRQLLLEVLRNKYIWMLAIAYFFVYVIRVGVNSWINLFMIETKGYSTLGANGCASLFEVGGFFGCLSAGWISDRLFNARRGPVNALFAAAIVGSVTLLWLVPPGYDMIDSIVMFLVGVAVFGPQMLIGIAATELCDKKAAATANGFVGWIAYIGAASAGFPLGFVVDNLGWGGYFIALLICSVITLALLISTWGFAAETHSTSPKAEYA